VAAPELVHRRLDARQFKEAGMTRFTPALLGVLAAIFITFHAGAATLDTVKERGSLNCGGNGQLPGFGMSDAQGNWTGFDVDLCRAIAAAIFNSANKVKFIALTNANRFAALQAGDVDVLIRNTTWTLSRDSQLGLNATGVNYYDGQGFMVRKSLKINSALELNDATICVQRGGTTELNVADYFRTNRMRLKTVLLQTFDEAVRTYETSRCDAFTTDASGLYGARLKLARADDHVILPEIISKEPLSPFVRRGDDQWFDIVKWVHFAMLDAEELNVGKANVEEQAKSENHDIKRLLGSEGNFGEGLGLSKDWAYRIVKLVGNYRDVFDRNLGDGSPLKIARGLNALWTKGGIQYAPPIR
jgi:general L-amino acid transport system substrate-binding protein